MLCSILDYIDSIKESDNDKSKNSINFCGIYFLSLILCRTLTKGDDLFAA